jgi:hypothetical protein
MCFAAGGYFVLRAGDGRLDAEHNPTTVRPFPLHILYQPLSIADEKRRATP